MSLFDRLLGRSAGRRPSARQVAGSAVDDDLERWVTTAGGLSERLGPGGRLTVALLGESLLEGPPSPWFGYEPSAAGMEELLSALGEDPAAAAELTGSEVAMTGRRLGEPSPASRERWRAVLDAALRDPAVRDLLPERDAAHLEAEAVWRSAAASVQPWRAVQLHPDAALRQVRWYPGCATRTHLGYSDPLGLAAVERAVEEHRFSADEWQALRPADEASRRAVDPLAWRLSSLRFAVEATGATDD